MNPTRTMSRAELDAAYRTAAAEVRRLRPKHRYTDAFYLAVERVNAIKALLVPYWDAEEAVNDLGMTEAEHRAMLDAPESRAS